MASALPVLFSGIQPTGAMHLGNYLGAVRQWVSYQQDHDCLFCLVDLHALTLPRRPDEFRRQALELTALLLACRIDPRRVILFLQSQVPEHVELSWILSCITPLSWLERMTQYKERAALRQSTEAGLLYYPVLQASDIVLYQAAVVPVGEDQQQHLEVARELARRFNHLFGPTLTLPRAQILRRGGRIMSLANPLTKMSKGDKTQYGVVRLLDEPDQIRAAIRHAVTDSGQEIVFDTRPEKAGINNLLTIYQLLSGEEEAQIEQRFAGRGYSALKEELADLVIEHLGPIQREYRRLISDEDHLRDVLRAGEQRARQRARPTMTAVRERVGLLPAPAPG